MLERNYLLIKFVKYSFISEKTPNIFKYGVNLQEIYLYCFYIHFHYIPASLVCTIIPGLKLLFPIEFTACAVTV